VLFQELALIRWIPGQVRVVAYFPNLILISAFLGLGIGSLRSGRRSLAPLWIPSLLLLVATATLMSEVVFTAKSETEHLWLLYSNLSPDATVFNGVRLPLIGLFILSAACFVPMGQALATRLERFRRDSSSLWGYSLDLLGSLLGVITFAVVSFQGVFPVYWFVGLVLVGSVPFIIRRASDMAVHWIVAAVVVALVWGNERAELYSPYYAISAQTFDTMSDYQILANGSLHQIARRLDNDAPITSVRDGDNRRGYHFPYQQLTRPLGNVLVLGAGSGNDVAVLLDEGAEHIDVVEIDPVILQLGRDHHPNRPYDSERVEIFATDARSFLNDTDRTYDLIVYGTLDSMTSLSALSNVRLDNFVYTLDGIEAARKRLTPQGGLIMYFMVVLPHINEHLFGMLTQVFGETPTVQNGSFMLFNTIYMAGPAFAHLQRTSPERQAEYMSTVLPYLDVPTDDWPFLYLQSRSVSNFYLSLIAVFLALAVLGVILASREMRQSLKRGGAGMDVEMFLFGLAFLLLETRFVTSMSLVWGATWLTSAVVFGSILGMILLATIATKLRPMPWNVASVGLVVSLLVVYLIPGEALLGRTIVPRLGLSVLLIGTPIFFAAVCFALRFASREVVSVAFGWNLLGAVAGGLLEFFSMSVGLKALLLFAVTAYLLAFLAKARQESGREGLRAGLEAG
jgi:spermidine synthase